MTTHTMKMALATEADMDVAYELAGLVDTVSRGDYPSTDGDEEAPDWFDADDIDHLKALHKRIEKIAQGSGSIWRVLGGWSCMVNPSNQVLDLTNDVVELHPRILAALAAETAFDMTAHLARQREWSEKTFGPGPRAKGVVDHIRKELFEIEADPADLKEWVDVVILALDGAWRSGATPEQIIAAIVAKQTKNEGRVWPDWRTADPDKAIEHDRSAD